MICQELADRASEHLADVEWVTFNEGRFIKALNGACRAIATLRTDASQKTETVSLTGGVRHSIPAGGTQFLGANRNFQTGGELPGRTIALKIADDRAKLDPYWQTEPQESEVLEVMPDKTDPLYFWTYPPIKTGTLIEIVYAVLPQEIATLDDDLPIHDRFAEPVLQWVLYELYNTDSSSPHHFERAEAARAVAMQLLGLSSQRAARSRPKVKEGET